MLLCLILTSSRDEHPFFPKPGLGNFGIFLGPFPDRWGQTLMKRREALQTMSTTDLVWKRSSVRLPFL